MNLFLKERKINPVHVDTQLGSGLEFHGRELKNNGEILQRERKREHRESPCCCVPILIVSR